VLGIHMKRWNELLMGTYAGTIASITGAPTDEDDEKWDAPHSIFQALAATGTYCGVDRDAVGNSYWKGNTIATATVPRINFLSHFNTWLLLRWDDDEPLLEAYLPEFDIRRARSSQ
jgi:hypothetical protein